MLGEEGGRALGSTVLPGPITAMSTATPRNAGWGGAASPSSPHQGKFSELAPAPARELTSLKAESVFITGSASPRGRLINVSVINLTKWEVADVVGKCDSAWDCVSRQT